MESDITVNEDVKSQFKAFQEQQRKRLQNVMERKKEKQNSMKDAGSTEESLRSLNDPNLFKTGPPVNEDCSKSSLEAENQQLQAQLREVRDENCRLYKLVSEKDFEIKQLQKRVQEDGLALSGMSGLAGDVAATKIVELAKKNREITAEAESERARVKQLNHKVKKLERELQAAAEKIRSLGGDAAGIKESALKMLEGNLAESPEVKALQEKLNAANLKVMEHRNQLQSMKQELKMTQKLLISEVGEDVNIQSLLTNSGSWRGRAQQIIILQSKVRELEHKLSQNKIRTSLLEMNGELLPFADSSKLSFQEKNLLKIRSLEKEKKESWEKLAREHNTLQRNHEELQKKLDASKARNKILCGEMKMLRGQIGTLLEKGQHDDELIDTLLSQQKQMQEILKGLSQKQGENKECLPMDSETENENSLVEQLRKSVAERDSTVKTLQEQVGKLTLQMKSAPPRDSSGAAYPPSSEHSGRLLGSGSIEPARTESTRTVSKMGHTLVESAATEPFILKDNSPPGRSEEQTPSACAFLSSAGRGSLGWKVLQAQITVLQAWSQAAAGERDRLLELVAVLQKRVDESSDEVLEDEEKLPEEQRQSNILEHLLEELEVDPGSSTTAQKLHLTVESRLALILRYSKQLCAALSELPLQSQVEELSTRLAIERNENKALKAALEETVRKRDEDFQLYQDTMEQVKNSFSQAIQQQKQEES